MEMKGERHEALMKLKCEYQKEEKTIVGFLLFLGKGDWFEYSDKYWAQNKGHSVVNFLTPQQLYKLYKKSCK